MKPKQARYWYTYLQRLADSLDTLNEADGHSDLLYTAVNAAIRMAAQTAMGHCEDVTKTDEFPAVDLGEAS